MKKEQKIQLLKDVQAGKVPKEALNPPSFEIKLANDGSMFYQIAGETVDRSVFFQERDRLCVSPFDVKFEIQLWNSNTMQSQIKRS